ncbi:hypothetical protein [Caballeronia sp. LZ034LL]|uniref:hypothetical protein n=1 Tax=Caballeronia sp. LZ034LL TaxID=3038567 RepID=UPI00285F8CED|nr:hypothetical protein [Caballeronia sp. LZ034LL]MDR5834006.1 hypothetical protein [Caballeronia sp. LZ034LL]
MGQERCVAISATATGSQAGATALGSLPSALCMLRHACRMKHAKYRLAFSIKHSKRKTQNAKRKTQNAKRKTQNAKRKTPDP